VNGVKASSGYLPEHWLRHVAALHSFLNDSATSLRGFGLLAVSCPSCLIVWEALILPTRRVWFLADSSTLEFISSSQMITTLCRSGFKTVNCKPQEARVARQLIIGCV